MRLRSRFDRVGACFKSTVLVLFLIAVCQNQAGSQQPADSTPADSTPTEADHLRAAQRHMRSLELRRRESDEGVIELVDRPLLSFGDAARMHQRGSFWAWGKTGRPAAFMELWQDVDEPELWRHAITLSSAERLSLNAGVSGRWTPPQTPLETPPIADAPEPSREEAGRLRQIKDLARRFTAHEFWNPENSRYELRLLPQPVHRYADAPARIHDGAVFIIAHGTNPEMVLLIEAQGESLASSRWRYALIPSSSAEVHVALDGKEIWQRGRVPNIVGSPVASYWLFRSPAESEP